MGQSVFNIPARFSHVHGLRSRALSASNQTVGDLNSTLERSAVQRITIGLTKKLCWEMRTGLVPDQLVPTRIPSALSVLAMKTLDDVEHVDRRLRQSGLSWVENMSVSMALSPSSLDVGSIAN